MKRGGRLQRRTALASNTRLRRDGPIRRRRPNPAKVASWRKVHAEVSDRVWCEANIDNVCPPGRHYGEHAHHVVLRARGGCDEAWNLRWVCHVAHGHIHANPAWATDHGLMASR